jgi:hypothetical protein
MVGISTIKCPTRYRSVRRIMPYPLKCGHFVTLQFRGKCSDANFSSFSHSSSCFYLIFFYHFLLHMKFKQAQGVQMVGKKTENMRNQKDPSTQSHNNLNQRGSRNMTGQKTLPTIWSTYVKFVTTYQMSAINSCWEKCDKKWAYTTFFRRIFISNY